MQLHTLPALLELCPWLRLPRGRPLPVTSLSKHAQTLLITFWLLSSHARRSARARASPWMEGGMAPTNQDDTEGHWFKWKVVALGGGGICVPLYLTFCVSPYSIHNFVACTFHISSALEMRCHFGVLQDKPLCSFMQSELISSKGYPSEEHKVVTEDGYILGIYRIPNGVQNQGSSGNDLWTRCKTGHNI